jgi:hypothetical protein
MTTHTTETSMVMPAARKKPMNEENSVLRWGGLAGMLGSVLSIVGFVVLFVFVPPAPSDPKQLVATFPDGKAATIVEEILYIAALMLMSVLILTLYRVLRGASLAPALFGAGLSLLGYVLLAAGAVTVVAFSHLSDLYHAPGTTPQDQATLGLVWQGVQALFDETDTEGFILLTTGLTLLGISMLRNPAFGRRFGGVIIVFGLAALAAILLFSVVITARIGFAPFAILVLIIVPLLVGWKVYSLSRAA